MPKSKDNLIKFVADKVRLTGPKQDGSFTVSFDVGEYMWHNIKELPMVNGSIIGVGVMASPRDQKEKNDSPIEDQPLIEG